MSTLKTGSPEHKELLCRFFIDTHVPFEPKNLPWPNLDAACVARLRALPIWDEAVKTEVEAAMKVTELGKAEKDPLLSEAISLQGYEEARHAEMLRIMVQRYGLDWKTQPNLTPPADPSWTFMRVGYGDFSLRKFVEICIRENERRLELYDERLLRPSFVPTVARQMIKVLPRDAQDVPAAA